MRALILIAGIIALAAWVKRAQASQAPTYLLTYDPATAQPVYVASNQPETVYTDFQENHRYPEGYDMAPPPENVTMPTAPDPATQNDELTRRIAALQYVIKMFESNNDYSILYGGGHFNDFSKHPQVRVPFLNPVTGRGDISTAAGAYQINWPTWNTEIQPALHLLDFSPASQDQAALYLLNKTGAIAALAANDLPTALQRASTRWASLPGSTARQNPKSYEQAAAVYSAALAA